MAGNETGITTFQLDIKSEGLTLATLERALMQVSQDHPVVVGVKRGG